MKYLVYEDNSDGGRILLAECKDEKVALSYVKWLETRKRKLQKAYFLLSREFTHYNIKRVYEDSDIVELLKTEKTLILSGIEKGVNFNLESMTNEEKKSNEIAAEYLMGHDRLEVTYEEMREAVMTMAEWKDKQFKEYLEKKRNSINLNYHNGAIEANAYVWDAINEIINELFGGE